MEYISIFNLLCFQTFRDLAKIFTEIFVLCREAGDDWGNGRLCWRRKKIFGELFVCMNCQRGFAVRGMVSII